MGGRDVTSKHIEECHCPVPELLRFRLAVVDMVRGSVATFMSCRVVHHAKLNLCT